MAASAGTLTIAPDVVRPPTTARPVQGDRPAAPAADSDLTEGGGAAPATQRRKVSKERRQALRRTRGRTFSTDPDDPQPRLPFRDANAGAAIWQKAIRWLVALFVVLFAAVGIVKTIRPTETVTANDIAKVVDARLGVSGFPVERGQALAAQFIQVYFSWSEANPDGRAAALAAYLPEDIPDGWDGRGAQTVVSTPILAAPVEEIDEHRANFTMSFVLDSGRWLYATVQVYADDGGNVIAASLPVLLPAPDTAAFPGNNGFEFDADVSDALVPVLSSFFQAWAASDQESLDRYVTTDATVDARAGLAGAVSLVQVDDIHAEAVGADGDADVRQAVATVTWKNESGGSTFDQQYLITVVRQEERWFVRDITVGLPVAGEQGASSGQADESSSSTASSSGGASGGSAPPSSAGDPGSVPGG